MTDVDLFALGCAVGFITLGGIYVFMRERFRSRTPRMQPSEVRRLREAARRGDHAA